MRTAAQRSVTREIGPLEMRADIVPDSFNEEERTVELVWTTGARVERFSFRRWESYLEELSLDPGHVRMGRLESGAPLLDAHNGHSNSGVIGVVESATVGKGEGRATVRFAKDDDGPAPNIAEAIFQKVKDRILRNVSVGYRVHRTELIEDDSDEMPVYRATDWEPYEISMVPMGADAGAGVRSEPQTNICEFINPLAEEQRTMDPAEKPATPSAPVAATPAAASPDAARAAELKTATDAAKTEAVAEEKTRAAAIERTARTLGLDPGFTRKHIADGTTVDAFRAVAMDAYEERKESPVAVGARPSISPGEDVSDKFARGASDWIVTRSAMGAKVAKDEKQRGIENKIDPGEFRGLTLMDLARRSLEIAGIDTRGMSKMEMVGKALSHRSSSTSDFPVLLGNTINRVLLAAWGTTPDTWSRFCSVGSVSDFRAHDRIRMGTFGSLDTVLEGGEFKTKSVPDGRSESISALTKGNLVSITRQAIINDDLSAFSRTATMLGRAAKLSIETTVYAALAENGGLGPDMSDALPLFDAAHANIGGGNALSVAAIDADRIVMAIQTDESSNEILDLTPRTLVLPIGLGGLARKINSSEFDIDTDGGLAPNTVLGLFADIVDTGRLTGTRRYEFADPAIAPVLEVAFLDGQQEPFMEMRQGFVVDGTEWKVRMDFGVAGVGFRGAVTDAGV